MPQPDELKVVTIDEGNGPTKVAKDSSGRVITAEQLDVIRQKQEADLAKANDLKDKLVAGEAGATTQVLGQVKGELKQRLMQIDRQKSDATATLAKLEANDATAVTEVIGRMVEQVSRRAELIAEARDRSVDAIQRIQAK